MTTPTCRFAIAAALSRRLACADLQQAGFPNQRPVMATMAASPLIAGLCKKLMRSIKNANGKICFFYCTLISQMISFVQSQRNITKI
jgi:hypothetical protein